MSFQNLLERFHKKIKVNTEELREKREILVEKIKLSLKNLNHPICSVINQGSYIYGVGTKPVGKQEYDIDVGLVFPIKAIDHDPILVRNWVYDAIKNHTTNVENRGPCIRVRYANGYHVDLVIYAQYYDDINQDNYQLAKADNTWSETNPKDLKKYIENARQNFVLTKDDTGADQIQRITRYLKRWNDIDIPEDSPNKPTGLAMLLLVIEYLTSPCISNNESDDIAALTLIAQKITQLPDRISIYKPTPPYEDLFKKLNKEAMIRLKNRFQVLLGDLYKIKNLPEREALETLSKQFGLEMVDANLSIINQENILDMKRAIPSYKSPAKPWCNTNGGKE
ncbi:TPA: nucleotidyltransferase [Legionella pneumophila]|nr:nucleotidyltransferase [Legionella pneumophila]HAU1546686.1 nucleotidyltransferase [Legionella pneumophila]